MSVWSGVLTNVHLYVDLIALVAAGLTLIPIYRDHGRKFFSVALVLLFLCVAAMSVAITRLHQSELLKVQHHIVESLRSGPNTFDELAQSLGYREVGQLSEALDTMLDASESEIRHDDVRLQNCDGSILAVVRRYYIRAQ